MNLRDEEKSGEEVAAEALASAKALVALVPNDLMLRLITTDLGRRAELESLAANLQDRLDQTEGFLARMRPQMRAYDGTAHMIRTALQRLRRGLQRGGKVAV